MNVAKLYNIPWDEHSKYEFDHLIPRCLGGADDEKNLFPEILSGPWNAHIKDKVEVRACSMVCNGKLDLKETQNAFQADWVSLYKQLFPDLGDK